VVGRNIVGGLVWEKKASGMKKGKKIEKSVAKRVAGKLKKKTGKKPRRA